MTPKRALLLLALVVAGCAGPAASSGGESGAGEGGSGAGEKRRTGGTKKLWRWLEENGAELHFTPRVGAYGVRGGVTDEPIPAGGVIARVPMRLVMQFDPPEDHDGMLRIAEEVARASVNASSEWAPYLASLPTLWDLHHTMSYDNIPPAYLPLIQDEIMERFITTKQDDTRRYWQRRGRSLDAAGVTYKRLRSALITVSTRYFATRRKANLAPALDLLNHANGCETIAMVGPCPKNKTQACLAITSRLPHQANQEICNAYGWLTPDAAVFQYGFLLQDDPPALSRMDWHGYDGTALDEMLQEAPKPFKGNFLDMEDEAARLLRRLEEIKAFDEEASQWPKDEEADPKGAKLRLLLAWREQRKKALDHEISRLSAAAAEAEAKALYGERARLVRAREARRLRAEAEAGRARGKGEEEEEEEKEEL